MRTLYSLRSVSSMPARSTWSLSVKSTGVKFRVVTFPSTVMANVVKRNGRLRMWERLLRRDVFLVTRNGTLGSLRYLLRFANLMFERHHFLFHLAQFHVRDYHARFVKEINERAGQAADQDDEKT